MEDIFAEANRLRELVCEVLPDWYVSEVAINDDEPVLPVFFLFAEADGVRLRGRENTVVELARRALRAELDEFSVNLRFDDYYVELARYGGQWKLSVGNGPGGGLYIGSREAGDALVEVTAGGVTATEWIRGEEPGFTEKDIRRLESLVDEAERELKEGGEFHEEFMRILEMAKRHRDMIDRLVSTLESSE